MMTLDSVKETAFLFKNVVLLLVLLGAFAVATFMVDWFTR
jgi:hypothetical protein